MSSLSIMLFGSFLIQFVGMSLVMTDSYENITFSLGKFYISCIMAILMALLDLLTMQNFYWPYWAFFGTWLFIFIYAYRNQVYIEQEDYLQEMIEHHSMAILTTEAVLQKNTSEEIKRFAENLLSVQEAEITFMKKAID
jgi:hypothetical protein